MRRLHFLFALMAMLIGSACAADFGIAPIKLFFDRQTRSAVVSVSNDGEQPLVVQMSLSRWTQDANGKDVYTDSEDLQFYPRLMSIPPKDRRNIRIGVRVPAEGDGEVTYRFFINEVLQPQEKAATSQVLLAFRFALPIFVAPNKPQALAEITSVVFEPGADRNAGKIIAHVAVRNAGNENFRIESIRLGPAQGKPLVEMDGWYLLPNITREHLLAFEPVDCDKVKQLELAVKTDKPAVSKTIDLAASACRK